MMRHLKFCAVAATLLAPGAAAEEWRPTPVATIPVHSAIQDQTNQDRPVEIDAPYLEVRDESKLATFSGGVRLAQGSTTMQCQKLLVFYGQETGTAQQVDAQSGSQSPQPIRRIEAYGGVTVVTKDQSASGDVGIYDLVANTITLSGFDGGDSTTLHPDQDNAR
jgi:lipopolysaccharide export system protein LptA